jgi:hypothetical protein
MKEKGIDWKAFFDSLSPEEQDLVEALRDVVRHAVPQAKETVLWGGLSYHRPEVGGRVKGAICMIEAKRGRVQLAFIHGIRMADPHGLLQGKQLSKRQVPIESVADAQRPEIAALLRAAATLDPTTWEKV